MPEAFQRTSPEHDAQDAENHTGDGVYHELAERAVEEAGIEVSSADQDVSTGERIDSKPLTRIDVRRHSEYDGGFPENGWGKATKDEKETLGHLTEEGVQNAHRVAKGLVEQRLEETEGNVDFLVVSSPTYWLGDEQLGQRAIETAGIYADEVLRALDEIGLPSSHLLNTQHSKKRQHPRGNVRQSSKVVEAQMFDDPGMIPIIDELREKYGGQGTEFWDAWYAGADNEALDQVGAERSTDAAERADRLIEQLIRYGNLHNKVTGRNLEVIVITHHEVLQPYALHKLGVSPEEFVPGKNEGFEVSSDGEKTVVTIAGREVERVSPRNRKKQA